jgi:hypothetical protein
MMFGEETDEELSSPRTAGDPLHIKLEDKVAPMADKKTLLSTQKVSYCHFSKEN